MLEERHKTLQQQLSQLAQQNLDRRVRQAQLRGEIAVVRSQVLKSIGDDKLDEKTVLQWNEKLIKVSQQLSGLMSDAVGKAVQAQLQELRIAYTEQKQTLSAVIPLFPPTARAPVEATLAETLKKLEAVMAWEKSFAEQCGTQAAHNKLAWQSLQTELQTVQMEVSERAAELDQPGSVVLSTPSSPNSLPKTMKSALATVASTAKIEASLNQDLLEREQMTPWIERIQQDTGFIKVLLSIIEHSKTEALVAVAAANAITLLNAAGISLSGYDFSDIRIPGADLSGGLVERTRFDRADLRRVNFQDAWLRSTRFNSAQTQGLRFGEYACWGDDYSAICVFSPNGRLLARGRNDIQIYDRITYKLVRKISSFSAEITTIAWSPSGERLAITTKEHDYPYKICKLVMLFDVETGILVKKYELPCSQTSVVWDSIRRIFISRWFGRNYPYFR